MKRTYNVFLVKSNGAHELCASVEAGNALSALKKFSQRLTSSGFCEIHKVHNGKNGTYELSTSYGAYYYCTAA